MVSHPSARTFFCAAILLIFFFRCGHCKNLAPHYEEAATTLKDKNIKLAKVDCVDQADLCQEQEVKGYPYVSFNAHAIGNELILPLSRTLKTFRSGESSPYTGPRKADGIVSYMVK